MNIKINNYEDIKNIFIKSNSNEWVFLKDKEYFIISKNQNNKYCISSIKDNWETFNPILNDIVNIEKCLFDIFFKNNNSLIYCSYLNKNNPPFEIEENRFINYFSKIFTNELIDIKRYLNDADLHNTVSYWVYTKNFKDFDKLHKKYINKYQKSNDYIPLITNKLLNCFKFINSPVIDKLIEIANNEKIDLKFVPAFNLKNCNYKNEILKLYKKWIGIKLILENIVFGDYYFIPEYNIINFDQIIRLINNEIRKRKIH